ncbi:MAG: glutamate synthase central domain-containing protein, partial [Gammaproteobacteria bacterium]
MQKDYPQVHTPPTEGLYDPAYEHDACGVAFVVDIKGRKSHKIIDNALTILKNLLHRGACGCEENTGDGVGILIQKPHKFFQRVCADIGIELPESENYGAGMVFLPVDQAQSKRCQEIFKQIIEEEGQQLLGWRDVPTDDSLLGPTARAGEPTFKQIFIAKNDELDSAAFDRKLYVIRKRVEYTIWNSGLSELDMFYIPSLSYRTFLYKGMLTGTQFEPMFPDLTDADVESALALVHQRFSTNTFPAWKLAHPFRYISHNGEINTVRGNANWMRARESLCESELFGDDLKKLFPIVIEGGSDSATFDNVMEFLHMAGRPLPHAVLMMIPEAWSGHETMDEERKAFYEYHACLMEPWDGPASIAFTDGEVIGAVLDRNGLRPSRYYVTKDDMVIMASEVGVLEVAPENVKIKGRLHPGRIFLVDTKQGRIIDDAELKKQFATEHPYGEWLKQNLMPVEKLTDPKQIHGSDPDTLLQRQQAFGYTHEDLRILMAPMAANGLEPTGSMGTDAALAVLSDRSRLLYDYFKQMFAQVTNPPLDGIREELVTQVATTIGPEGNLLKPAPESCRRIKINSPILSNEELARIRDVHLPGFKTKTIPILYPVAEGGAGLDKALSEVCA